MSAIPYVAAETATGTTGADGLTIFTFSADITPANHMVAVDRLQQANGIDYLVSGARQITFYSPSIPLAGATIWLWNQGSTLASNPYVANETATGTTGSNGLTVFTFSTDIDTTDHLLTVDRLPQGRSYDYTVTAAREVTFIAPNIPLAGATIWLFNSSGGASGTSIATSLPRFENVATIISDAAIELGLISTAIANPFASTDPNILQMIGLLKGTGRDLAKQHEWTFMQKEYTFSTVSGTANYLMPTDFRSMIDQSGWNRSTIFPMGGPLSPQMWQCLKALPVIGAITVLFRPLGGQLSLLPTPTTTHTLAFEYLSTSWIKPSGQLNPTSDTPTLYSDTVCYDPLLAVRALKLAFVKAKGFDTGAAKEEYDAALADAKAEDGGSPILRLRRNMGIPLISNTNIPITGYGA